MQVESLKDPLIEIIIPNWNGADMLSDCLESLRLQRYKHFTVTVVDNGSTDNSLQLLEENYPEVNVIPIDHNSGFSVAVNRGIKHSTAPWMLLLNNDMEVSPDCLENVARGLAVYDDAHFFALKMMNFHHREFVDGAGDAILRGGVGYRLGTLEKDKKRYQQDRQTFGACAGAALYSREFFDRIGYFDEDFFAYLEDVDLNLRAARQGLKCMYLSDAVVYHIGSATSGSKINPMTIRLSTRNNLNLILKNYSFYMLIRFFLPLVIFQTMWFVFCLKKKMIKPYLIGLFQAFSTTGKYYRKRKDLFLEDSGIKVSRVLAQKIISAEKDAVASIIARREEAGRKNLLLNWYGRIFF